jgi:hypothetical protein
MSHITINLLEGSPCISARKAFEFSDGSCVSLGVASYNPGPSVPIAWFHCLVAGVAFIDGQEFYDEVKACKSSTDAENVCYRRFLVYLSTHVDLFLKFLLNIQDAARLDGREEQKEIIREALGIHQ